ncbi:MAG: hypothetical protein U5Q16_01205 [Gammaproteobacteria bacterium]|nr:hypothetical protein [Gammaproteobacteria bacterium]
MVAFMPEPQTLFTVGGAAAVRQAGPAHGLAGARACSRPALMTLPRNALADLSGLHPAVGQGRLHGVGAELGAPHADRAP